MKKEVAIIGNPNTGKTSLFNTLTGFRQHVGNWPGKTVEQKTGRIKYESTEFKLVDLPGIYSLNPYSSEEVVANNYITESKDITVVNIVDASNLERNLLLTLQLIEKKEKIVLALNNNKFAEKHRIKIDKKILENKLGIPVIKIEAINDIGKEELLNQLTKENKFKSKLIIPKETKKKYSLIDSIIKDCVSKKEIKTSGSDKLDKIITHKYLGLPIFFLMMYLLFEFTYTFATPFMDGIDLFFGFLGNLANQQLTFLPGWVLSLLIDGIINGVGSVIIFLPNILLLFFLISILEDSGYLARAAYVMNRFMNKVGLPGQSFIPLLLGFGCNVPAIMATRTLRNKRDKILTILINPFMSCSARLVVYMLFVGIFFKSHQGLVLFSLYLLGILIAFTSGLILRKSLFKGKRSNFIMEFPHYRIPRLKNALVNMRDKGYTFLKTAGTIIFIVVVFIWFLASMPYGVEYASQNSVIGKIGSFIAPVFEPLGFGTWQMSVSLVFGFLAKEVVIGIFGSLYGVGQESLAGVMAGIFTPLSAYAFMAFILLYIPCMATIAVIKRETGSWKWTLFSIIYSSGVAYIVTLIIYQGGKLLGLG